MEQGKDKGFVAKDWTIGQLNALIKNLGEFEARDIQRGRKFRLDVSPIVRSERFAVVPEQRAFSITEKMKGASAKFGCRIKSEHLDGLMRETGESQIFVNVVDRGSYLRDLTPWFVNRLSASLNFAQLYYMLNKKMIAVGPERNGYHLFPIRTPLYKDILLRVIRFTDAGLMVDEILPESFDQYHGSARIYTVEPLA